MGANIDTSWADSTWNIVPTHAGYRASEDGLLIGPRGHVLKPLVAQSGHLYVLTHPPRKPRKLSVHRAVLLAFVGPPPEGYEALHADGDPTNNRLSNLSWGTRLQNKADMLRHGKERRGEAKANHILTWDDVKAIRADPRSARRIGEDYGVSHSTILNVRRGNTWKVS